MKKYNLFKVILITIGIVALLTWLIPASNYGDTGVVLGEVNMVGIWQLFTYFVRVMQNMGAPIVFVLIVGGFYGILNITGVYKQLIERIVRKFRKLEKVFLIGIAILLAIITSVSNLSIAIFAVFPLVISILLLMGFDRLTVLTTIVGSTLAGLIGSTFSYYGAGAINAELFLEVNTEIISRIFLLIISLFLLVTYILNNKVTVKLPKNYEEPLYLETKESKKKLWPLVTILSLTLLIMILSSLAWEPVFNVTWFKEIYQKIMTYEIATFPVFRKILGNVPPFGNWGINEFSVLLLMAAIVLAWIYKVKLDDAIESFVEGSKRVLSIAILVGLVHVVFLITYYHLFYFTIVNWMLNLTNTFNIVTMIIVTAIGSVLIVDISYFAEALRIFTDIITDKNVYPAMGILLQSIYGLTMLLAPTSIILVMGLRYLNVPYMTWLKHIYKYVLQLLIVITIISTIIILI